ncbi:hypothetical protein ACTXGQ_12575 [Marinobacter sp. 1Y8]
MNSSPVSIFTDQRSPVRRQSQLRIDPIAGHPGTHRQWRMETSTTLSAICFGHPDRITTSPTLLQQRHPEPVSQTTTITGGLV